MKKTVKTTKTVKTANTNMEEIMKAAEVKVEVKGTTEPKIEEVKEKRVYRSFKEIILERITKRAQTTNLLTKNLNFLFIL